MPGDRQHSTRVHLAANTVLLPIEVVRCAVQRSLAKVMGGDMLRDLLVHVSGDEIGRKRVSLAVDLADRTEARLSSLHITAPADIPPRYKPSQIDAAVTQFAAELRAEAHAAELIFEEETRQRLGHARWFEAEGDVAKGVSNRARFADLVILGQDEYQEPAEAHPLPVAHSVVLSCGRPVLV